MSKTIQLEAFVCVDEHGNYQLVGSSKQTDNHKKIAVVEEGITKEGISYSTKSFKVNFELPEHKETDDLIEK